MPPSLHRWARRVLVFPSAMASYLFILLSLLTLVLGHPVGEANPLLDENAITPAPKLSPRTDLSLVDEPAVNDLEKRQQILPYRCSQAGMVFCAAWCEDNSLVWSCIRLENGRRTGYEQNRRSCGDYICFPEFLSRRTNLPDNGCGAKAACISKGRLVRIICRRGSTTCGGLNSDIVGKRPRVASRMFDTGDINKGVYTPEAPDQITLLDGANNFVQAVGPGDEQGGTFLSLPFNYIGGVQECVRLSVDQSDMTVWSALILT